MTLQERYEQEERNLKEFDTIQNAFDYAKVNADCSTADKACYIMQKPNRKKFVVAMLPLCSHLNRKGYKEILNPFDINDIIQGKADFSDSIEEI